MIRTIFELIVIVVIGLAIIVAVLMVRSAARAADLNVPQSVKSACTMDALRLCPAYMFDPPAMSACMQRPENLKRISKGCLDAYSKWKKGK